jgi:ribulose-5-phosphate 4-epimerase/fuculose-1-phosphate aldolase
MAQHVVSEGVIKFSALHESRPLTPRRFGSLAGRLMAWREIMAKTELVGQRPDRYDGAGYGNVSGRIGAPTAPRRRRGFLITGTQTGGRSCLELGDFCVVESVEPVLNRVSSYGEIMPSSESMTHAAIYDLSSRIRFVLHAHSPVIWRQRERLSLPTTATSVEYGTPEMAREVERLYRSTRLAELGILAMGGHEDGIIVFGHSCEEAGQVLLSHLARAYELLCLEHHSR